MWARRLIDKLMADEDDDRRYERSAKDAEAQHGSVTHVEATAADAARLGVT
jgi:hypothetical protein